MSKAPTYFEPTRKDATQRLEQLELDSENYSLILLNPGCDPTKITDPKLRAMCDEGEGTLYPAIYRLVYDQ